MQASGQWTLQLHSGEGHQQIRHGPGDDDFGPYYAYKEQGESFEDWQVRGREDIDWGEETLAEHVPDYEPYAFALPYGSYGQDGTNDAARPGRPARVPHLAVRRRLRAGRERAGEAGEARSRSAASRSRARTTGGEIYEQLLTG